MRFSRNDRPYAAPRVADVATSARYQVNVTMMNCLTGYRANVYADIETFDRAVRFDNVATKLP